LKAVLESAEGRGGVSAEAEVEYVEYIGGGKVGKGGGGVGGALDTYHPLAFVIFRRCFQALMK
jgi:hypothetical protein